MRTKRARRPSTERFALCLAPGSKRTLLALLALGSSGVITVRRAAVRSAAEDIYAVRAAAQMYRTGRQEAPMAVVIYHDPEHDPEPLAEAIRRQVGPFADIKAMATAPDHVPGKWGTAVHGAASGLGFTLTDSPSAVLLLAKECELKAGGTD